MLSGNKYTSRSSLGSTIYQCLQQIPKEDYLSAFRDWVKKVTKMCFSKGGILWRFVIKICLIKCSTEVIRIQWQNFLQDPRSWSRPILFVSTCSILSFWKQTANMPRSDWGDARSLWTRLPFLKWGLYGKRFFFLCNIHILKFNLTTTVKEHTGSRHIEGWAQDYGNSSIFLKPLFRGYLDPFVNNANLGAIAHTSNGT